MLYQTPYIHIIKAVSAQTLRHIEFVIFLKNFRLVAMNWKKLQYFVETTKL